MQTLRGIWILTIFLLSALFVIPWQSLALRFKWKRRKTFPKSYSHFLCRLFGLNIRIVGTPVQDRGVLMVANHTSYLDIIVLGDEIGQASGMKMCYGALTKGLAALGTELLVAAKAMGLDQALKAEFTRSQGPVLASLERTLPGMPPKAYRWVGEMEEISATFGAVGLPPELMMGAAAVYRLISETELGKETPEERRLGQSADEVVALLADSLREPIL